MNQLPSTTSIKENQKKLYNLDKKIKFLENARNAFQASVVILGYASMFIGFITIRIFGVPFHSIFLVYHCLSFLCLFIVHYQLLPSLIDERSGICYKIKCKTSHPPAYHPPKNELFRCYQGILFTFLTSAGLWELLTYNGMIINMEDGDEHDDRMPARCLVLSVLLMIASLISWGQMGPLYSESKINKPKTKQVKENTNKTVSLTNQDISLKEDVVRTGIIQQLTEHREEISSNSTLLKQHDKILKELQEKTRQAIELQVKTKKELDRKIERLSTENVKSEGEQ